MRRIFIILGLLILILFFSLQFLNIAVAQTAVPLPIPPTPSIATPRPPSPTPAIPCDDPKATCLTTQPCSAQGCQVYNCVEKNGNVFCKNPTGSSTCPGDKCLYSQSCASQECKVYKCGDISSGVKQLLGMDLVCVPPKAGSEITREPTEPSPPSFPCAKGVDSNGKTTTDPKQIKSCSSVATGLGIDISTNPAGLIKSIFSLILGLSGGIALLLIILSGYKLMTSRGSPEALQGAQEQLTSAIIGLLFIIFSLVILQVIGVDILKIPGLGK